MTPDWNDLPSFEELDRVADDAPGRQELLAAVGSRYRRTVTRRRYYALGSVAAAVLLVAGSAAALSPTHSATPSGPQTVAASPSLSTTTSALAVPTTPIRTAARSTTSTRSTIRPTESTSATRGPSRPSTPAADPTALTGITWLLVRAVVAGVTYQSPQPAGSSVYKSYTVQFSQAQVGGNDGCNSIGAAATVTAHVVNISGDIRMTAVACVNTKLRAAYDRALFHGSISWAVSGGRLTLTTAGGDTYQYIPTPAGYPSDLAGTPHPATAERSVDGIRYRIYSDPSADGSVQCLTMEFNSPAGTPWEPVGVCRMKAAAAYGGSRTDLFSGRLPSDTGVVLGAVPTGTTSRIVFRPGGRGPAIDFNLTPLPGTALQAFYGFVEHPTGGGGTLTFYDVQGKPYKDVYKVAW